MKELSLEVGNLTGLHARPAAMVVSAANKFSSELSISKGAKTVNLKSMLLVLSLGICKGDIITLHAEGPDETDAINIIASTIASLED